MGNLLIRFQALTAVFDFQEFGREVASIRVLQERQDFGSV